MLLAWMLTWNASSNIGPNVESLVVELCLIIVSTQSAKASSLTAKIHTKSHWMSLSTGERNRVLIFGPKRRTEISKLATFCSSGVVGFRTTIEGLQKKDTSWAPEPTTKIRFAGVAQEPAILNWFHDSYFAAMRQRLRLGLWQVVCIGEYFHVLN